MAARAWQRNWQFAFKSDLLIPWKDEESKVLLGALSQAHQVMVECSSW
jgi:hypothetical protein